MMTAHSPLLRFLSPSHVQSIVFASTYSATSSARGAITRREATTTEVMFVPTIATPSRRQEGFPLPINLLDRQAV
jgi:hypothetical protein